MSWLARSLANSLGIDAGDGEDIISDHGGGDDDHTTDDRRNRAGSSFSKREKQGRKDHRKQEGDRSGSPTRRAKEDFSEFTEILTRELWGVANFLAPPPTYTPSGSHDQCDHCPVTECNRREPTNPSVSGDDESSVDAHIAGIAGDRSKSIGRVSEEFSRFSNVREASEDSRFEASYNWFGSMYEDEDWIGQAVGITDEVLAFAGNIAHHPETWLDFPIDEEDDLDDFTMSDSQKLHALAIEHLTPRLAALRIEFCPAHMSEGYFWKVYFVLLHSRLNKQDAQLLSTPQVVEARVKWMQELQKQTKIESSWHRGTPKYCKESDNLLHEDVISASPRTEHSEDMPQWTYTSEPASSTAIDSLSERHLALSTEMRFFDNSDVIEKQAIKTVDKSMPAGPSSPRLLVQNFGDDDDDDWPEDDLSGHRKSIAAIDFGIDEDVSFSDLEDDDHILPIKSHVGLKD
ncbi:hypothetical protein Nepgr_015486 [Nepenthes gracilis]|uniref:BSD domain-containing protein n=1 Tax=Nepenthes gracilis TaxID=150966 RepID=A0AAD3SMY7_NEPGR|nr:hypothetical protein Nepgr_015486 [Nepenthes gracilis]